jgi:hypothetical protein
LLHVGHLQTAVQAEQLVELSTAAPVQPAALLEQEELLAADGFPGGTTFAPELRLADFIDRLSVRYRSM